MKLNVCIREAQRADVPELHSVIQRAYRTNESWTTECDFVEGERISREEIYSIITAGKEPILVACDVDREDSVVGCIQVQVSYTLNEIEAIRKNPTLILERYITGKFPGNINMDEGHLGMFAVDPSYQSRGLGKRLMEYALEYVKVKEQKKFVTINVIEKREDLLAWYRRLGFVDTGKRLPFVYPHLQKQPFNFKVLALTF